MSPDKLVYMANQIGKFFMSQGADKAEAGIAEHLQKFWDPRMRVAIFEHLDRGGAGLDPTVRQAISILRAKTSGPAQALVEARQSKPAGGKDGNSRQAGRLSRLWGWNPRSSH
jgi:formate dehydrogenase subunit delta